MQHKTIACALALSLLGSSAALSQEALSKVDARVIAEDFSARLSDGFSYGMRCGDFARYSGAVVVNVSANNGVALVQIRVNVTNLSADLAHNSRLVDCFGGSSPKRGETVAVLLYATYRKTVRGWRFE